jgi:CheY-like chemotaxis protein
LKKVDRIILIDDDEANNFISEGLISRLEIAKEINVFLNGDEAITFIEHNCMNGTEMCTSIIILDHLMPVMDGKEFLQELNKLKISNRDEVYVLLLAVHTNEKDIKEFQELGIQDFTSKPLAEVSLWEAYHKYWDRRYISQVPDEGN